MVNPSARLLRGNWFLTGMALLTVVLFCLCMTLGRFHVPFGQFFRVVLSAVLPLHRDWSQNVENVVWAVRFPRLCGAVLVGSSLALSGAAYQSLFRNPLVSADLLGVSAGACVGASLAIICDLAAVMVQIGSLCGGLLAVACTSAIPKLFRSGSNLMMVLSGVIVAGFFRAVQGLLLAAANPETQLGTITYWTMGSLARTGTDLYSLAGPMALAAAVLLAVRWRLNLLSLGEEEARTLGLNVVWTRNVTVLCATALTACSICLAGTVGWISLVVPHFGRLLVGSDNRRLLPVTAFVGASLMIVVDTLARCLTRSEIPLSVLTGFIGAPLYVWLLTRQRRQMGR